MSFSIPVFRPGLRNPYTFSDLVEVEFRPEFKQCILKSISYLLIPFFLIYLELKRLIRSYTPVVSSKTIPDARPQRAKSIPVFRPKRRKNPTLWGGTYLYGLFKGESPRGRYMGFPSIKIFVCIHTVVCWCGGEALKVIILPLRLSEGVVCCTPTIFKPILGRKEIYLPLLFLFLTFSLPSRHWIVKPLFLSRALSRLLREIRGSVDRLGISCRELTFAIFRKARPQHC